ncbi:MAG: ComF family protein [Caldilineaceae bacterium]|nr:ComF family protein [Caldilineaceae bacterium]
MAQRLFARLRHAARIGLDLLFPRVCAGCGRLGELFCPDCAQAVEAVPQPCCARCGIPLPAPTARCANCQRHAHDPLTLTRTAALHSHPLREAIHAFKYQAQPELAPLLARYLVAVYAQSPWTGLRQPISAVVPVPLHAQRLQERGYNQSALLAAAFSRAVGLPMQPAWLERTRETRQQVGLAPGERHANVDGAFYAAEEVAGQCLLLIDDVYTTGSTLRACATAALAAGATAVYGLTLAQPVRRAYSTRVRESSMDSASDDRVSWAGEL